MQANIQEQLTALVERITELEQQLASIQSRDTLVPNRIECRELRIVSEEGALLVTLSAHEEFEGGAIRVISKTGKVLSSIYTDDEGGVVSVSPIQPRDPDLPDVGAVLQVDDNNNGYIAVFGSDGEDRASLSVAPPRLGGSGRVVVHGTIDNRERVVIGCNPETDNGSIKTYSGTWQETHSLEDEPGDLRIIAPPSGDSSDIPHYHHVLNEIEENLQKETDERQKRYLNVKKATLSRIVVQAEEVSS